MLNSTSMTSIFDRLFENYDPKVMPSEDGSPLKIRAGIFINDMVPLQSMNMVRRLFTKHTTSI